MKRLLILLALVGCGPSVREQYVLESDVLSKLEAELNIAENPVDSLEDEIMWLKHQVDEPNPEMEGMIFLKGGETIEPAEVPGKIAELEKAKQPYLPRLNEIKPKVESQRKLVSDLESQL